MKAPGYRPTGFTLVELAIVMTIIGLLIGGILKGEELLINAKIKRTIRDVNGLTAATVSFRDKYSTYPGDYSKATTRVGGCQSFTPQGAWCDDGDGNAIVGDPNARWKTDQQVFSNQNDPRLETLMFWKHLALDGFITGVDPYADPTNLGWGGTNPASAFNGGFTIGRDDNTGGQGQAFKLQKPLSGHPLVANMTPGTGVLRPRHAEILDRKMDDGYPETGWVVGESGGSKCDEDSATTSKYLDVNKEFGDSHNCLMLFFFNRR